MVLPLLQHRVVTAFSCLGADCPDTCCAGWDMPVDAQQLARYRSEAPELLATVDLSEGIMKKDASTACTQLCEGICAIQNGYGANFLGDSCHFYPRIVHAIGGRQLMVCSTSCPEMLRLILSEDAPFTREPIVLGRMPGIRRELLPEGMTPDTMLEIMDGYMRMAEDSARSPELIMLQLLARTGEGMEGGVGKPVGAHVVYYALALTEAFSNAPRRTALDTVMQAMEQRLGCGFDRAERSLDFTPMAASKLAQLEMQWQQASPALAPVLRRWIQAQLAMTAFPFGGISGLTAFERVAVLVQRFATVRLGLMCHLGADGTPPDAVTTIRVIQVLSRFMDHLADGDLTRMIFRDLGMTSPAQLRQWVQR